MVSLPVVKSFLQRTTWRAWRASGVQGVGGDDRAGQVDGVQQWPEGGDLVAIVGDLPLGEHMTGVVHRGKQRDVRGRGGARAAQGLAVDGDRPQPGGHSGSGAGGEERSDCPVQGVAIEMDEEAAQGVGVGNAHRAGQRVDGEAESPAGPHRGVRDPFRDRGASARRPERSPRQRPPARAADRCGRGRHAVRAPDPGNRTGGSRPVVEPARKSGPVGPARWARGKMQEQARTRQVFMGLRHSHDHRDRACTAFAPARTRTSTPTPGQPGVPDESLSRNGPCE